jgi:hypothetical protein
MWAWGVGGGGVVVAGVGGVLLLVAESKESDLDGLPTATVADLDALKDKEDSGKAFNRAGNALFVVGAAAAITGGVFIYLSGREYVDEERPVVITPVPMRGGGGVALTWSLP